MWLVFMVCFFPPFTSLITFLDHNPAFMPSPTSSSRDIVEFSTFHRSGYPVAAETIASMLSESVVTSPCVSHTPSDVHSVCISDFTVVQTISIFYNNVVHSRGVGIHSYCCSTDSLVLDALVHMHSLNIAAGCSVSEIQYSILHHLVCGDCFQTTALNSSRPHGSWLDIV